MTAEKKNKIWVIVLCLSLAVNLFVAGVYLGEGFARDRPARLAPDVIRVEKSLSAPDRAVVAAVAATYNTRFRPLYGEMKDIRKTLRGLTAADTLDESALTAAIQREAEIKKEIILLLRAAKQDILAAVSPAGQAVLQPLSLRHLPPPRHTGKVQNDTPAPPFIWAEEFMRGD